jgi:hypothetical protein
VLLQIIAALGSGIAAPSANPYKRLSPTSAAQVMGSLAGRIAAVLDGGACKVGLESTIVDLTGDTARILRSGPITREQLEAVLGQPVVIENRPGAQGTIAGTAVARAAPDGYSVMIGSGTTHGAAPSLLRSMPYDPVRDFTPVLRLGHITQVLVVRAEHPAQDLPGLARQLRTATEPVLYGSGSSGNLLPAASLLRHLGVQGEVVTYRSPPLALPDLIAGRFGFMFIDLSAAIGAIRNGQLRALAISSPIFAKAARALSPTSAIAFFMYCRYEPPWRASSREMMS